MYGYANVTGEFIIIHVEYAGLTYDEALGPLSAVLPDTRVAVSDGLIIHAAPDRLSYSAPTTPGMSGGAVAIVHSQLGLIGVHWGCAARRTQFEDGVYP